jgi:hypothetical protein
MRVCGRCGVRVASLYEAYCDAFDAVAIKEGEAEEIAGYDTLGEPLCPDCVGNLSLQSTPHEDTDLSPGAPS